MGDREDTPSTFVTQMPAAMNFPDMTKANASFRGRLAEDDTFSFSRKTGPFLQARRILSSSPGNALILVSHSSNSSTISQLS